MAARHTDFVSRVQSALRAHDVAVGIMEPHDALRVARESMYREMSGSDWNASLPGDKVMACCPEDGAKAGAGHMLWPQLRDQLFYTDPVTRGGQRFDFGENAYSPVDINIGSEDPRPFVELAATLGLDRIPWRARSSSKAAASPPCRSRIPEDLQRTVNSPGPDRWTRASPGSRSRSAMRTRADSRRHCSEMATMRPAVSRDTRYRHCNLTDLQERSLWRRGRNIKALRDVGLARASL